MSRLFLALLLAACESERAPAPPRPADPPPPPPAASDAAPPRPGGLVRSLTFGPGEHGLELRAALDNPHILAPGDTVALRTTCDPGGQPETDVTQLELEGAAPPAELTWSYLAGGAPVTRCQVELTRVRRREDTQLGTWCAGAGGALEAAPCPGLVTVPSQTRIEARAGSFRDFLQVDGHVTAAGTARDARVLAKAVCAGSSHGTVVWTGEDRLGVHPIGVAAGDRHRFWISMHRVESEPPSACSIVVALGPELGHPSPFDARTFCWRGDATTDGACPGLPVELPAAVEDVRPPPAGVRIESFRARLDEMVVGLTAVVRLTQPVGHAHVMVRGRCDGPKGEVELRLEQLTDASLTLLQRGERAVLTRDLYHLAGGAPRRCDLEVALGFPWLATLDTPLGRYCVDARRARRGACR